MGVPAFFRWLSRKYPSVIIECVEEKNFVSETGESIPIDFSQPNPNGVEFDNLYLDMNGIIHPCTHPEDKPAPKNEDEMMIAIFECIDRLMAIVRPRKLLYMAIDGVAPRAKMNQQRSRRFRASKETNEKIREIARIRAELKEKGFKVPPEKPKEEHFDSNCITPGTPFMDRLSKCLHYYIHDRLNNNPCWKSIKVILSDANVPGEGEHKIMDFIRKQRASPNHDPNTQHVLCGADADLIMLGLATHEPYFTIIREEFKPNMDRPCDICGRKGHEFKDCLGTEDEGPVEIEKIYSQVQFIFVRLFVLREYLEKELIMVNLPFEYDFERAIDDWVFMCFFVGNDFLPHLPSLEIRENAIDRLIKLYKDCCYTTGGWLTDSGRVNMRRVQIIMTNLGKVEDEIFRERQQREAHFKQRDKQRKLQEKIEKAAAAQFRDKTGAGALGVMPAGVTATAHGAKNLIMQQRIKTMEAMKANNSGPYGKGGWRQNESLSQGSTEGDSDPEPEDEVRLHEAGFKERYYESKFEVSPRDLSFRELVANEYAIGLCWVLRYYYQGCASWGWFFPYHYAPFASDFKSCGNVKVNFQLGTPFKPLEQLMGVFPAASRSHVPEPWGELMVSPSSTIIDFYPDDFKIDLNGKKFAWQGVALLPFVDEARLKLALESVQDKLTSEEKRRNVRGSNRLYVSQHHKAYRQLRDMYRMGMDYDTAVQISGNDFDRMSGSILLAMDNIEEAETVHSTVRGLPNIAMNKVVSVRYCDPSYSQDFVFPSKRLRGVKSPPRVLKPSDQPVNLIRGGGRGGGRGFGPRPSYGAPPGSSSAPNAYKPVLGFMGHLPQQVSLDISGHRAVNRSVNEVMRYNAIPPPPLMDSVGQHNVHRSGGGNFNSVAGGYRGGYESNRGGFQSNRSYNSGRGEYESHRGGYDSRGDYSISRGGYNNRGGGYSGGNARGGYGSRGNNRGGSYRGYNQQAGRGYGY